MSNDKLCAGRYDVFFFEWEFLANQPISDQYLYKKNQSYGLFSLSITSLPINYSLPEGWIKITEKEAGMTIITPKSLENIGYNTNHTEKPLVF